MSVVEELEYALEISAGVIMIDGFDHLVAFMVGRINR